MKWGVFYEDGMYPGGVLVRIHVAPCLADGRLPTRHMLSTKCICGPKLEPYRDHPAHTEIYVHQDREAGGYNS